MSSKESLSLKLIKTAQKKPLRKEGPRENHNDLIQKQEINIKNCKGLKVKSIMFLLNNLLKLA